jgi:hypothetical protein
MENRIETTDWKADGSTYIDQGFVLIEENNRWFWCK